jgi:hypothetical protein
MVTKKPSIKAKKSNPRDAAAERTGGAAGKTTRSRAPKADARTKSTVKKSTATSKSTPTEFSRTDDAKMATSPAKNAAPRKAERELPVGIKTTAEGRESQIRRLKERLAEMKAYKVLIAEEGLFPDEEDKARESDLIVQLLRLEKGLDAKVPPRSAKKKVT